MDVDKLAADFRLATRRLRSRGPGRRYPASMRQKAEDYLRARRQAGVPVGLIARELASAAVRWLDGPEAGEASAPRSCR